MHCCVCTLINILLYPNGQFWGCATTAFRERYVLYLSQQSATGRSLQPNESSLPIASDYSRDHFDVILPSTSLFSKWLFSYVLRNQNVLCIHVLFHTPEFPHWSRLSWFDHPSGIWHSVNTFAVTRQDKKASDAFNVTKTIKSVHIMLKIKETNSVQSSEDLTCILTIYKTYVPSSLWTHFVSNTKIAWSMLSREAVAICY